MNIYGGFLVPGTGLEPAHPCERCDLNTVRLPISPPGLFLCKIANIENYKVSAQNLSAKLIQLFPALPPR